MFGWNPGDGNDTIEGQDGFDRLFLNGSNANENIDISANGERVRFFRDVASVTMDLNDVERIEFHALGGADNIVIGDVSGTDLVAGVVIDLESALDSNVGDGQVDTVTVSGTNGDNTIKVGTFNVVIGITGASTAVAIQHAEATDRALGGDDVIDASGLTATQVNLTLNGGLGADVFIGSQGNDLVNGGDADDLALLGPGNDTVEGQAGLDTLLFNGANVAENINISANGGRALFFRDVASVTMDLNDVERIEFHALGGADHIVINDVSGTDLAAGVIVDLEGALGSGAGDGQVDRVTVIGAAGNDTINIGTFNGVVGITGAPAPVAIRHAEATDQLTVNGGAGNNTINASALTAGTIGLTLDGGNGDDVIIGSQGNDTLFGVFGNDLLFGGAGVDHLFGGPGQDTFMFSGTSLTIPVWATRTAT